MRFVSSSFGTCVAGSPSGRQCGLLDDVDLGDPTDQRVAVDAFAVSFPLDVVDRIVADGRDRQPGTVDELLEHQRVVRLLDHLVVGEAVLQRPVGLGGGETQQTATEHPLEDAAGVGEAGAHVQTDA